ncbi:MAG: MFS transporter [Nocardioidaceae bacterium]
MTSERVPLPGAVRRLLVSHALASVGMSLPWPLLLVLVWERTGDGGHGELLLGLAGAARMLPYVLLSWATGRLADRFRRDRLLRATLAARVVLLAAVAVAVWQGRLLAAVVAAALTIACGTPAYPALAAAMPGAAGEARRRATDLLVTIEVASFVVGPALGGLLLAAPTRRWLPLCAVVLAVASYGLVLGVMLARPGRAADDRSGEGGVLQALRRSRVASRAVGVLGLLNAVDAVLVLGLLPVAARLWHDDAGGYGLATGMLGFGALGAPLLWRLGSSASGRARGGLLLLGAALAALAATGSVGAAVLPLVIAGAATVHVEGAATEAIQDGVPDAHRAGVLGLTDSVMVGAALLGSLAAPWLAGVLGPRGLLVSLALTCVATLTVVGRRAATTTPVSPATPVPWVPTQRAPGTEVPGAQPDGRRDAQRAPTTSGT